MKQILLILSMLISHTLIYGSAALRPAIQIGANNLFNTINSSNFTSSQIDNSSQITNIPTISNYLYQPIQVPKFDSKIIPFTPFKNQQQPIPLPSDLLKMPTNLIKSVTTEQSNSNIASSQNVNAKQQSKKAPTNTHIETLLFGFNQLDGFPSETERMIFFDMLNLKNRNKDENYIKNLTDATKYYSYKDLYNLEKEAKQLRADCGLPLDKLDCAEIESTILNTKIPASQRTEKENYKEWYSPSKSVKIEFLTNFFQNQHEIMNNIDLIIRLMPENISLGQLATMIIYAEHLADDKPLTMKHVREAILTIQDGPKGSMRDPLQKDVHIYKINEYNRPEGLTIHYEKGKLKSTALHEASHAFAQIEAYLPQFVSTLTIEPRSDAHGYILNNNSYEHITIYNFTNTQFLQTIIMTLAGTIGEQIFDTYRYQGYSDAMLTDKKENILGKQALVIKMANLKKSYKRSYNA